MGDQAGIGLGTVVHLDLTVPEADALRDFYGAVVGWRPEPVDMGGYADYAMAVPTTGRPVAGVCHARGQNAALPPVWLAYVAVPDMDASLGRAAELGGAAVAGPIGEPGGRYAVIRDPAGAHLALMEAGTASPPPAMGGDDSSSPLGTVVGLDLTVPDAEPIRDFYAAVVGWTPRPVAMGGYADFEMAAAGGTPGAGICHARGANAGLPPVWLAYIGVDNLDATLRRCRDASGTVVAGPNGEAGSWRYAVIRDPAGAHLALMEAEPAG